MTSKSFVAFEMCIYTA